MGYFDALTSGCFKVAPDGRKLFFPWGALGKGYVVVSEENYERLHRQIKLYMIVGFAFILGPGLIGEILWTSIIVIFFIVFYLAWMWRLLPELQPSSEKLSFNESITAQAHAHSTWMLWFLTICSLVFVGIGIFILIVDQKSWLISISTIGLFGLCFAVFLRMLFLRRRASSRTG